MEAEYEFQPLENSENIILLCKKCADPDEIYYVHEDILCDQCDCSEPEEDDNNNNNNLNIFMQDCCFSFKKKTAINAGPVKN